MVWWKVLALMTVGVLNAEIIDRIAVTVGREVITLSRLNEEVRITAFLNLVPVDNSPAARRKAADRLVEQTLVRREMELSRYPLPKPEDVEAYRTQVVKQYGGEEAFDAAMKRDDLNEDIVKTHLALQLMMLRFLDYRFRPEIDVNEHDIEDAYQLHVEEWKRTHNGPPPTLDSLREGLRKQIDDERISGAFSRWIEETRKQVAVNYLEPSLK